MEDSDFLLKVRELKINPRWYSLDGALRDDCYVLENNLSFFNVFYYERGEKLLLKTFESRDAALFYLFELLKRQVDLGVNLS